jgi:ArsR family transcriptional regulator
MTPKLAEAPEARTNGHMPELSDRLVKNLVQVFKLLSDETRLRILLYLAQREEMHVTALCDMLGQSQPAVSHHLALLRVAGLIEPRREGKHNYYYIRGEHFRELMEELFSSLPAETRQIRFDDFVLSYNS